MSQHDSDIYGNCTDIVINSTINKAQKNNDSSNGESKIIYLVSAMSSALFIFIMCNLYKNMLKNRSNLNSQDIDIETPNGKGEQDKPRKYFSSIVNSKAPLATIYEEGSDPRNIS